jgi:hypothetical protein
MATKPAGVGELRGLSGCEETQKRRRVLVGCPFHIKLRTHHDHCKGWFYLGT